SLQSTASVLHNGIVALNAEANRDNQVEIPTSEVLSELDFGLIPMAPAPSASGEGPVPIMY
ncbi:hypothetical protein BVRB_039510, partial [Beta vulgaris subsp. vulgaris]